MSTLLDLPEARERVKRWTVAEYERITELGVLGKNVELIRGFLVEKMSKSPLHRFFAQALYDLLNKFLPEGYCVMIESPLRLSDSEPEPDVMVVHGEKNDFREQHPSSAALVIEVAVSNVDLDRENASLYAEAGVEEYWIVLPKLSQVEVYRTPRDGGYSEKVTMAAPSMLICASVPSVQVDLDKLFAAA